jgi:peptide/nickel transport system permease protein
MRLLAGIPVFVVVTYAATVLADFMPGSAAQTILGDHASPQQIAALNAQYGYDLPSWERYLTWLWGLLHGDLGTTLYSHQPLTRLLFDRAAVTFEIALLAMLASLLAAFPLAMFTSIRPGGVIDAVLGVISSVLLSVPVFVTVVVLGFLFSTVLTWLPATGWVALSADPLGNLRSAALPVMCLSVHQAAYFYRVIRSEMLATLKEDFVLVARAKNLPAAAILLRHVLRPSLPQVLTVFGLSLAYLLGGSFIVESYFAVPGIGWTVLAAVAGHDLGLLQAILSLTVVIFVLIFTAVDLGYAIIDPRVAVS